MSCSRCGNPGAQGIHCAACLSTSKLGVCNMCDKNFDFFPEHPDYKHLESRFLFTCDPCNDKSNHKCVECGKRKDDFVLVLCDGCGCNGQTCFDCLGVDEAPDEPYGHSSACQEKIQKFYKQQPKESLKRQRSDLLAEEEKNRREIRQRQEQELWDERVALREARNSTQKELISEQDARLSLEDKARRYDEVVQIHARVKELETLYTKYATYNRLKQDIQKRDSALESCRTFNISLEIQLGLKQIPEKDSIDEFLRNVEIINSYAEKNAQLEALEAELAFPEPDITAWMSECFKSIYDKCK